MASYTAVFPKVDYAVRFEARIAEPGWWAVNVGRKGRTVTWDVEIPADASTTEGEYFVDMLDSVGYYGSTQSRKATLNGVKAPMSY